MILEWFDASDATKFGVDLADQCAPQRERGSSTVGNQSGNEIRSNDLQLMLERADREIRGLGLNFYKKAKFANSFKWRLLENGVEKSVADKVTQQLVMHLSGNLPQSKGVEYPTSIKASRPNDAKQLLALGNRSIAQGNYMEAIGLYQDVIRITPHSVVAFNNLGAALAKLGRFKDAEPCFYQAIKIEPNSPDAYSNLGNALLLKGQYADAEQFLRRALKLNPRHMDARVNLGLVLSFLGRLREAASHFEKVLKYEPRHADALSGLAFTAMTEGNFSLTDTLLNRALQVNPRMPRALALRAGVRKMSSADTAWLALAEDVADSGVPPLDEADLRFAIAKNYDDIADYKQAFHNYRRANELLKSIAEPYDRAAYKGIVDGMIRSYTKNVVNRVNGGTSNSTKPVLIVGMPRSGTSLLEQIIASHPSAEGAGELQFWANAVHEDKSLVLGAQLDDRKRQAMAEAYLKVLETKSREALCIVDKAPGNADYLGLIHTVFPSARIVYMQRDPIDTCLSCYFQKFALSLNFSMDLSDLADYYREHRRLIAHWRSVLPAGTMLEVPYEDLVADQEGWSRKILEFLGLEWDERVLSFHDTKRAVTTASFWQVRQKMYTNSVQRWRNYEEFIGPLRDLGKLAR